MLPPRDYPETNQQGLPGSNRAEDKPVTVRGVLDRLDSKQPVTDAMITTAVTNLFTADTYPGTEAPARVVAPRVPKVLSALFSSVRRS